MSYRKRSNLFWGQPSSYSVDTAAKSTGLGADDFHIYAEVQLSGQLYSQGG
jgi:hypothetical protein